MAGLVVVLFYVMIGGFVFKVVSDLRDEKELRRKNLQALKDFEKNVLGK